VKCLDVAVGLGAAGVGSRVLAIEALDHVGELAFELVAVVGQQALQAPAGGGQVRTGTAAAGRLSSVVRKAGLGWRSTRGSMGDRSDH
jgi:hypothetical protein